MKSFFLYVNMFLTFFKKTWHPKKNFSFPALWKIEQIDEMLPFPIKCSISPLKNAIFSIFPWMADLQNSTISKIHSFFFHTQAGFFHEFFISSIFKDFSADTQIRICEQSFQNLCILPQGIRLVRVQLRHDELHRAVMVNIGGEFLGSFWFFPPNSHREAFSARICAHARRCAAHARACTCTCAMSHSYHRFFKTNLSIFYVTSLYLRTTPPLNRWVEKKTIDSKSLC